MSLVHPPSSYAGGLILATRRPPVTTIVLNAPETRNALTSDGARMLARALADADRDEEIRAIVLTGNGNFCGGAHLDALPGADWYFPWAGEGGPLEKRLSKPLIGAIEGYASAEGFGLALLCDIRIVDSTAVFGVFGRRLGLTGDGTAARLPAIVGAAQAMDILLSGCAIGCDRALAIGLATRKAANTGTRAAAEKLAREIAAFSPSALARDRAAAQAAIDGDPQRALTMDVEASTDVFFGEGRQAVRALIAAPHAPRAAGQRGAA